MNHNDRCRMITVFPCYTRPNGRDSLTYRVTGGRHCYPVPSARDCLSYFVTALVTATLEPQFQSQLDLSRIVGSITSRTHFAKVRAGEIACTRDRNNSVAAESRSVEVRVVEDIEELSSELHREAFAESEVLEGGEIQPLERRSGNLGRRTTQQAEATVDWNASRYRSQIRSG